VDLNSTSSVLCTLGQQREFCVFTGGFPRRFLLTIEKCASPGHHSVSPTPFPSLRATSDDFFVEKWAKQMKEELDFFVVLQSNQTPATTPRRSVNGLRMAHV